LVLKETGKLAEPSAARRPTEEFRGVDTSESNSGEDHTDQENNEGFMTDSSNHNLNTTTKGKHPGRDAAKRNESQMENMKKRTAALKSFAATEEKKLKVMQELRTQVHAQNMIAMLNHPTVTGNAPLSDKMAKSVMKSLGVDLEEEESEDEPCDVWEQQQHADRMGLNRTERRGASPDEEPRFEGRRFEGRCFEGRRGALTQEQPEAVVGIEDQIVIEERHTCG